MYEKKVSKNGRTMYFQAGKLISAKQIPTDILAGLENQEQPIQDDVPNPDECIWCGSYADSGRFMNGKVVRMCQTHYATMTTGETAQRLREIDGR